MLIKPTKMDIGNLEIEIVKKDIKNIHLAVYPPLGKVRLASPLDVNDKTIRLYALSKLGWIKRQQRRFAKQDRLTIRNYIDRETHYLFGRKYLLKVIEADQPASVKIKRNTVLELVVRPGSTKAQKEQVIEDFYREQLKTRLTDLIDKWQDRTGITIKEYGVRKMKTKWGTCNREAKRIWLNLELAKKPLSCVEYIIVHEMVHILERHHNDRFHALMKQFMPRWKHLKQELNNLPVSHLDWEY
jgi:hypothetical protein